MKLLAGQLAEIGRAVSRQMRARAVAYFPLKYRYEVAGEQLRALTLGDIPLLEYCDNAFIVGGYPTAENALQILWLASENYTPDSRRQRKFGARKRRKFSDAQLIAAVGDYIDEMYLDSGLWRRSDDPASGAAAKKPKPPHHAYAALITAELARFYHWSETDILKLELPRMWQYLHISRRYENSEYRWTQFSEYTAEEAARENKRNGG